MTTGFYLQNSNSNCNHEWVTLTLTPHLRHYGKETCQQCGRFVRWIPKPETLERMKVNAEKISALKTKPLGEWEKGFLLSLEKQGRHFSPKQQSKLDELIIRYA